MTTQGICAECGAHIHVERFLGQDFWCTGMSQAGHSPSRQSTTCPARQHGHYPEKSD